MTGMRLAIPDHVTAEIRRAQALAADGEVDAADAVFRALLEQVGDGPAQAVAVLHMWAIVIEDPHKKLAVNEEALRRADDDESFPAPLRASLLANLGFSHQAPVTGRQRVRGTSRRGQPLQAWTTTTTGQWCGQE